MTSDDREFLFDQFVLATAEFLAAKKKMEEAEAAYRKAHPAKQIQLSWGSRPRVSPTNRYDDFGNPLDGDEWS